MKRIAKTTKNILISILSYLILMIDRLILVPFQWVDSYSFITLSQKDDTQLLKSLVRVLLTLGITTLSIGVYFFIKIIW